MATSSQHLGPPQPRRPTAQRSVSLKHTEKSTSPKNSSSTDFDHSSGSPSSIIPLVSKNSSGESSNVDKWFDRSNNNAHGQKVVDNDPPFFLHQQSSSEESPNPRHTAATQSKLLTNQFNHMHVTPMHAETDESSSSDYRAVIDDLTVQNKKLRRRLKKYEKLHDAHLNNEKLFEVRVHGLSSTKRAELEGLLRKFAIAAAGPSNATASAGGSIALKRQESASASSNFADSAYVSATGSASASGQGSSGAVSNSLSGQTRHPYRKSVRSSNNNIQSYLHDIPEGLLPHHPAVMTEKTKQKVVVRRLEQIFAGTGAVQGDHHHPLQQQEVSQLAAKADRNALEATGKNVATEGSRIAPIMPVESEEYNHEASTEENTSSDSAQGIAPSQKISGHDFAPSSPDQRPTRPLDLDPHRAQNPYENLQYIRHLGFSPPDAHTMQSPEDGHGWIYLNFLINMAQLHTINVTVDFVKKALTDRNSKLELSEDGRKVRWKGGRDVTRSASEYGDGSPAHFARSPINKSPMKRSKSSHHIGTEQGQHPKKRMLENQNNKFVYTPLFFHRTSDEDSDVSSSSSDGESESQFLPIPGGESSAMTSSGVRTLSVKRHKKTDNGPMIFYSNAKFCTDLSGDPKTEVSMAYNPIMYRVASDRAVGVDSAPEPKKQSVFETRGQLNSIKELPEPMDLDDNPISQDKELQFPAQTPLSQSAGGYVKSPMELQASGVGGVYPSDNFAINVRTTLARAPNLDAAPDYRKQYSFKVANILQKSNIRPESRLALKEDIVQSSCQRLPPSELPPASCWIGHEEDFDDDMSEAESYQSFSQYMDFSGEVPSAAPQTIDVPYLGSDESDVDEMSDVEDDDDDDNQSDGSVDLLATARKLDPDSVRAREREYDAHMAERLAEDIPAGSSAATAGGGSGFASPASGVDMNEYRRARFEHARKKAQASSSTAPSIHRTKTSDSMIVNGQSP